MDLEQGIQELIERALLEDIGTGDITAEACIPENAQVTAKLIMKQAGVIAGLPYFHDIFHRLDSQLQITSFAKEGDFCHAGTKICTITGQAKGIFSAERVALNLVQHASGVATATQSFVRRVSGYRCAILDTRKTLPGLRALEKYAIKVGGGKSHRWGLSDRFIIKHHHINFLSHQYKKPIIEAVRRAKKHHPDSLVEVEMDRLSYLNEVVQSEADVVMLVNMLPDQARRCVELIRPTGKKIYLQSATDVTLDTIRYYSETGIDGIAVAALTTSVPALDIGLRYRET